MTEKEFNGLRIPEPCPQPWDQMQGNDQTRTCSKCRHAVHNFENLNQNEVSKIMDAVQKGETRCARIVFSGDGFLFQDDKPDRGSFPPPALPPLEDEKNKLRIGDRDRKGNVVIGKISPPFPSDKNDRKIRTTVKQTSLIDRLKKLFRF